MEFEQKAEPQTMALLSQSHRQELPRKVVPMPKNVKWLDCKYGLWLSRGNNRIKMDYIAEIHPPPFKSELDYLCLVLSCYLSPHHFGRHRDSLRTPRSTVCHVFWV